MARTRRQRIGDFKGSVAKYSEYLEQLVYHLQAQVRHLHQQVGHQHTVPIPSQPSTRQPIRSQPSTSQVVQSQPLTQQHFGSLTFQLETPESQAKKVTKPSIEPWRTLINGFLSQVPRDEASWSAKREKTHLHRQEALIHTFCLLTCRSPRVRSLRIGDAPSDEASILDLLEQYGGFTHALGAHKAYATQISYYSTLLFVCLAIVALQTGSDIEAVDGHMKIFLTEQQRKECTSGAIYLSRLRTGALWPVRRMDELFEKGLKHRGPEIFFLCGQSIHTYRKFAQCQGTERFSSEVVVCEPPKGELQADLPFHIPFLIKIILGDRCSLGQIYEALGTRLRHETFDEWAYAAWRRIDSMRRIESPPRARKRRRVTHDDETCEGRNDSLTETRLDRDVTSKTAAADSTQDDLGGIVIRLQSLIVNGLPDNIPDYIDRQEPCDISHNISERCSSSPHRLIHGTERMYFDANQPPSTVVSLGLLNFEEDELMLLNLDRIGAYS